jgi:hypothetical protein
VLLAFATFLSWLVASFVTWTVWQFQVPERAFHCSDYVPWTGIWSNLDTCERAGDAVKAGWTWEKIKDVQLMYQLAFFALWIGGGLLVFRAFQLAYTSIRQERTEPLANTPVPIVGEN